MINLSVAPFLGWTGCAAGGPGLGQAAEPAGPGESADAVRAGDLGFFKARHLEAFFKRAEAVLIADCYEDAPLAGGRAELDNGYADMCTADTLAASRPFGDRSARVFSLRPALSVTLG